jgi:hypothetical protein
MIRRRLIDVKRSNERVPEKQLIYLVDRAFLPSLYISQKWGWKKSLRIRSIDKQAVRITNP